jgi:hypothetical protein
VITERAEDSDPESEHGGSGCVEAGLLVETAEAWESVAAEPHLNPGYRAALRECARQLRDVTANLQTPDTGPAPSNPQGLP